jgi:putative phosphoribosyl transferase
MIFKNRTDAGRQLSKRLQGFAKRMDVTVLGIPRGGVTVAFEVASALHVSLDIFLSRKLGVPGHEELAFGAVAAGDGRYLDQQVISAAHISPEQIEAVTASVRETQAQRATLYRGTRPPLQIENRTIILVDDGIATGASVLAAIKALREMKPAKACAGGASGSALHMRLVEAACGRVGLPLRSRRLLCGWPVLR